MHPRDIQKIWVSFGPYKLLYFKVMAVILINGVLNALGVGIILPVVDAALSGGQSSFQDLPGMGFLDFFSQDISLVLLFFCLFLIFVLKAFFNILAVYLNSHLTQLFRVHWSIKIARHYMQGPFSYIVYNKHGFLVNNLLREPFLGAKALSGLLNLLLEISIFFCIFIITLIVDWKTVLLAGGGLAVLGYLFKNASNRFSINVGKKKMKYSQAITSEVSEFLQGLRLIKIFSQENFELKKLKYILRKLATLNVKFDTISTIPSAVPEVLVLAILLLVVLVKGIGALDAEKAMPIIVFFSYSALKLIVSATKIFRSKMIFLDNYPSLLLVSDLASKEYEPEFNRQGRRVEELETDILLRDVTFSYFKNAPLFEGLSLDFKKGKRTYLIGPSGSGKSTVVDLILGMFKVDGGQVLLNGLHVDEYNLQDLRSLFGYVGQDVMLFNGTVCENILFGKPDASEKEIIEAARLAGADEFIRTLPQGYDTLIGDRGLTVSGGQRQRISIARALIRNPEVLILDEATSALDQKLEQEILDSMLVHFSGKTIICITHRLQSARYADMIYVLENGRIKASGTYDELFDSLQTNQAVVSEDVEERRS